MMRDSSVTKHIPQMVWFTDDQLTSMLRKWRMIYIKPDKGSGGTGVIRVEQGGNSTYIVSWRNFSLRCHAFQLPHVLRRVMLRGHRYVIQRGVRLATVAGKPFDLRIVWVKPGDQWQLTWMSAKIAPRKNATVTNVAKGGTDARIMPTLRRMKPTVDAEEMRQQLKQVSGRIVRVLGKRFPVRILGLDMAIDKQRHIWFIEANTNPNFHGLRRIDPAAYRRFIRARRLIRRLGKKKAR